MKTPGYEINAVPQQEAVLHAVHVACGHIAPTWPLDQFIAVNPYWGFVGNSIYDAAKQVAAYSGSRMLMPRSFYREQVKAGTLRQEHLLEALQRFEGHISLEDLQDEIERDSPHGARIPLLTDLADSKRDLLHGMSIHDFVKHNLSQHCASYFDHFQSSWNAPHRMNLYQSWLQHAASDLSPKLLMGLPKMRHHARSLPNDAMSMIELALTSLSVTKHDWADYLTSLLMSINGWASWCSFERWQARLHQKDDDHIIQLLAIRLAWEHFVFLHLLEDDERDSWKEGWNKLRDRKERSFEDGFQVDWIFQEALEISYQNELCGALMCNALENTLRKANEPAVQAVFCIDVRSEVFRRCLEVCSYSIQTMGCAGFFGLPIAYTPIGTHGARPQLPGLLAPKLRVSESTGVQESDKQLILQKQRRARFQLTWKDFRSSATSMFTFVESCGFLYAYKLLRSTFPGLRSSNSDSGSMPAKGFALRPCLPHGATSETMCDLVAGILKNMSLTTGFARLILLTGHGSETVNNPHAAGLDCGACGGQTGEVNARVLAGLLNDQTIRAGLLRQGIAIPETTYVVAALHNTTTDEVTLFDTDLIPQTHLADLSRLKSWLQAAGHLARTERAVSVGITTSANVSEQQLLGKFKTRSRDWSQVRPEWGLANNAAFLIAPRSRSRGLNLQGRVFLHEYQSGLDSSGTVLENIMTAPMLVTNWINMQYYASTVDNQLYGSGNKVLHNVVGGRIGVFEGNGGDLRIGLPLQSLHDGYELRHTPLRLSVFIEASQSAITAIISKHKTVADLVHHAWLHLFQISPDTGTISRYRNGSWEICDLEFNRTKEEANTGREMYA